jgi:CO/xanthine dehydrogenase FAD-binding subunit
MREVFLPHDLQALWPMMADHPQAGLYAGGTDLLVKTRAKLMDPPALICLERIEELKGVEDRGDEIFIGAGISHAPLLAHPLIQEHFLVLAKALKVLGSPPVCRMGTIGGNIITASPAGDTLPPLYVLGAEVELRKATLCPLRCWKRSRPSRDRRSHPSMMSGPVPDIAGWWPETSFCVCWGERNLGFRSREYR